MNIQNAFPSKWLKSGDVEDGDLTLTIDRVEIEEIGSGEQQDRKPVIYFRETDKGMVLNKTNADTISKLHTPETDNWIGKQITVFATEVDFAGKQTLALRVRLRTPKPANNSKPAAQPMDAVTAFWKFVNDTGYDREAAKVLINDNAGDFAAALKILQAA
jgi:hypothetical protein